MGTELELAGIRKSWAGRSVLAGVDLSAERGEIVAILGASGCGKTTLLRIVAGLDEPDGGLVRMGGRDLTGEPPAARQLGVVFQDSALLPHLSVADNIGFALSARRSLRSENSGRVAAAAELVGCHALLDRAPGQLSGGEAQRVALARALVRNPRFVLLDEPLSSLDVHVRAAMRMDLRTALVASGATCLYVTHDQAEAFAIADRVAVLGDGAVQQLGGFHDLYHRPRTLAVASFVGDPVINVLEVDTHRLRAGPFVISIPEPLRDRRLVAAIRPVDVAVVRPGPGVDGLVVAAETSEHSTVVHVDVDGRRIRSLVDGEAPPLVGDRVGVTTGADRFHLFEGDSGEAVHHPAW